jgi:hypothetical protein
MAGVKSEADDPSAPLDEQEQLALISELEARNRRDTRAGRLALEAIGVLFAFVYVYIWSGSSAPEMTVSRALRLGMVPMCIVVAWFYMGYEHRRCLAKIEQLRKLTYNFKKA